jgi:DNA primase
MVEKAFDFLGLDYHASEKEAKLRCIFHHDAPGGKPNLYINLKGKPGVYHCFRCGVRGDFTQFLMEATGWSLVKVLIFCRKLAAAVEHISDEPPTRVDDPQQKQDDQAILAEFGYRHEYLYERGLQEDTLQRFQIGYDRDSNAIVFPWFDRLGQLVALKRRRVGEKQFFYQWIDGRNLLGTLFGLDLVKLNGTVWITEGEIDAMTLDQVFRYAHFERDYAVALGGSELHETQIAELLKKQPTAIVLMLDNDDAGREAQRTIRAQLNGRVRVLQAEYPDTGKDANELKYEQIIKIATSIPRK